MTRKKLITDIFKVDIGDIVTDAESLIGDVVDTGEQKPRLKINIDATHSGRITNNRVYPGVHVQDGLKTFLKPTPRPVLKEHRSGNDPIGRVSGAKFVKLKDGKAFNEDFKRPTKGLGSGYIELDLDIMDQDSIEKFVDGRFKEFSTRQSFDSFLCSYCGNDLAKEYCGHYPGSTVVLEGKGAKGKDKEIFVYGITGPLTYREVSVVNIPGDKFTKINDMELIGADSFENGDDILLQCASNDAYNLNSLYLTDSAGVELVDLTAHGNRTCVTAEDRQRLTGKVIFSVGPDFNPKDSEVEVDMEDQEKEEVEEVLDEKETKNTDSQDTTSDENSTPEADASETADQEDVVVPDKSEDADAEGNDDGLDNESIRAGYRALAAQVKSLESDLKDKNSEVKRLKGQLEEKDEELGNSKQVATDASTKLKMAYAQMLLDSRLILRKPDVADVSDLESYNAKQAELGERTLDSLKDSLSDLAPEIISFKENKGIASKDLLSEDKVENPVHNTKDNKETEEPKKENRRPTRTEVLEDIV